MSAKAFSYNQNTNFTYVHYEWSHAWLRPAAAQRSNATTLAGARAHKMFSDIIGPFATVSVL